jgi:hypothetical protein
MKFLMVCVCVCYNMKFVCKKLRELTLGIRVNSPKLHDRDATLRQFLGDSTCVLTYINISYMA